ncbi:MAG: NAD(P)-binding protein [Bacilli bacterium]|nr:NAD(P)-binding protein [Bacilli bacterium]
MIRVKNIKISINDNSEEHILNKVSKLLKTNINNYKIVKRSIDARDGNNILYIYTLDVEVKDELKIVLNDNISIAPDETYVFNSFGNININYRPIVIGAGPAGLFCAYILAEYGYKPIVFERGEDVDNRIKSVDEFFKNNKLNTESNIQFGEGGAGTFSDGKLNTLIKDVNNRMKKVFDIFVQNGAPEDIMYDNHPHVGTDILRKVIKNIRNKIIDMGGEFKFNSCLTNIIIKDNMVKSIVINDKDKYPTDVLFLCIGHSARDTFKMLNKNNINMESKSFAVGLRVIHKQELIDNALYHGHQDILGHAPYKLTYTTRSGKGVYSFCMCPGGYVINSSSVNNRLVVNGMSNRDRNSGYANSAIVVTVNKDDFGEDLFAGMRFQEQLEEKTYNIGKGSIPTQYLGDFIYNLKTEDLPDDLPILSSYVGANLNEVLPINISSSIKEAFIDYGNKIKDFNDNKTVLCGTETRTSSPIRIVRNDDGVSNIIGLYPCGEGAGYAGGITSAAVDGIKQAENMMKIYKKM